MKRENLTPDRIKNLVCPAEKTQIFLWDKKNTGLAVRVTRAGSKSFVFESKLDRRTIRITIGGCEAWELESVYSGRGAKRVEIKRGARQEATRLQNLIDQSIDPRDEKRDQLEAAKTKRQAAKRHDITVGEAWVVYVAERSPKWGDHHRHDHEAAIQAGGRPITRGGREGRTETVPGALHPLMGIKLKELSAEHIKAWLKIENINRPTKAALAFRLLRAFVAWCGEHPDYKGIVKPDVCLQKRVRQEVSKPNSKASDCMQREQLAAWFNAVHQISNPASRVYLQAVLLTGARRDEILSLRWEDVDFTWHSLTIADKVEGTRIIPLPPYLASLLASLPRRMGKDGNPVQWVFSSPTAASGRIQDPRLQLDKACIVAGIPKVTVHGLRRTFKNMSEWAECPSGVSAQLMGHKPSAIVEKHYTSRPLDLLRSWHCKIESWILTEAGIEQPEAEKVGLRLVKAA